MVNYVRGQHTVHNSTRVEELTGGKNSSVTNSGFRMPSTIRKGFVMKCRFEILLLCVLLGCIGCQRNENHMVFEVEDPDISASDSSVWEVNLTEVDASCGQCQFGMPGDGCDLAIRMEDKVYFVDGSSIDGYGDAHAKDGLCNCVRKAIVSGKVANGRFVASEMTLVGLTIPSAVVDEN